ncbi:hypothetical protein J6590_021626 [Homalodisca vitripennis]|nr:hypothetical protein J6590_021626 [Homalodisca vitripennis]
MFSSIESVLCEPGPDSGPGPGPGATISVSPGLVLISTLQIRVDRGPGATATRRCDLLDKESGDYVCRRARLNTSFRTVKVRTAITEAIITGDRSITREQYRARR